MLVLWTIVVGWSGNQSLANTAFSTRVTRLWPIITSVYEWLTSDKRVRCAASAASYLVGNLVNIGLCLPLRPTVRGGDVLARPLQCTGRDAERRCFMSCCEWIVNKQRPTSIGVVSAYTDRYHWYRPDTDTEYWHRSKPNMVSKKPASVPRLSRLFKQSECVYWATSLSDLTFAEPICWAKVQSKYLLKPKSEVISLSESLTCKSMV